MRDPSVSGHVLTSHRMLLIGVAWVIVTEIYAAEMQRGFQNTENRVGKGFAVAGLYVFIVGYCKHWRPFAFSMAKADDALGRRPHQQRDLAVRS